LSEKQSRIISKILSPAAYVWLRSQVSQAEIMEVQIGGSDRQILRGYIPNVSIFAHRAIYQGLHLAQAELAGTNIKINFGQILKGKLLQLLEPITVSGSLIFGHEELQASLSSPLLSTALKDFLIDLLVRHGSLEIAEFIKQSSITWEKVAIPPQQIALSGTASNGDRPPTPISLTTGIELVSPQILRIHNAKVQIEPDVSLDIAEFSVDLGDLVEIQKLTLRLDSILFKGNLQVLP
jgi:hypothetical protein